MEQVLFSFRNTCVHPPYVCGVCVTQSLIFCVVFCRSFVALSFVLFLLVIVPFFDMRLLILVFSFRCTISTNNIAVLFTVIIYLYYSLQWYVCTISSVDIFVCFSLIMVIMLTFSVVYPGFGSN